MRIAALLAVVCLATVTGCAVNPVTGKTELNLISTSDEISMGAQQYLPAQQSQGGQFKIDEELTRYVAEVGSKVASVSERQLPYEFVVLNNSVPNAWAMPGGKIAINRGLLIALDNEAELAAVLGHEVVHAAARHSANAMQRGMMLQGLVLATTLTAADSDYANYIVGGAQLGAQLITTKYGRGAELESDLYGIRYMVAAGYNPTGAITLQETFVKLSEGQETSWLEGLFASHPPSQERVDTNRQTVAELGKPTGILGRETYQQKIAFLKESKPFYDMFDRAQTIAQSGDRAQALQFVDRAIERVPGEARFLGLKGNLLYQEGQYSQAEEAFKQALGLDADYFEYHLGLGLIAAKQGNKAVAKQSLQRSNELLPTAIANNELGQLSLAAGQRNEAKQYFGNAMSTQGGVGQAAAVAFQRLDVTDSPDNYIQTRTRLSDQAFIVVDARNQASIDMGSVRVEISTTINGEVFSTELAGPISAGAAVSFNTGWQINQTDVVGAVVVRVKGVDL